MMLALFEPIFNMRFREALGHALREQLPAAIDWADGVAWDVRRRAEVFADAGARRRWRQYGVGRAKERAKDVKQHVQGLAGEGKKQKSQVAAGRTNSYRGRGGYHNNNHHARNAGDTYFGRAYDSTKRDRTRSPEDRTVRRRRDSRSPGDGGRGRNYSRSTNNHRSLSPEDDHRGRRETRSPYRRPSSRSMDATARRSTERQLREFQRARDAEIAARVQDRRSREDNPRAGPSTSGTTRAPATQEDVEMTPAPLIDFSGTVDNGKGKDKATAPPPSTSPSVADPLDFLADLFKAGPVEEDHFLIFDAQASSSLSWDVILDVLYLRFSHAGAQEGDKLALGLLLKTQMENFRAYVNPPTDLCWMDEIDPQDDSDVDSESDAGDFEFTYCDDDDSDYDEAMAAADGNEAEDTYIPDFTQSRPAPRRAAGPKKQPSPPADLTRLPYVWFQHMQVFFYPKVNPRIRRSKRDVVHDLRAMRNLPKRVWASETFQTALEDSGLLDTMHRISKPGNLLENTHFDVQQSFRFHNWKRSYPKLIVRWTATTISEEEYEATRPKPDPSYKFDQGDALELLSFISRETRMHPWAFNPMAVFFLLSCASFEYNSEIWLEPSLQTLNYPRIKGWNATKVYRTIMQLPLLVDTDSPVSRQFLSTLDIKLALIVTETWEHKTILRLVKKQLWRSDETSSQSMPPILTKPSPTARAPAATSSQGPELSSSSSEEEEPTPNAKQSKGSKRNAKKRKRKQKEENVKKKEERSRMVEELGGDVGSEQYLNCPHCAHLPLEERCIWEVAVTERADAESLIGAALTCAPKDDRLSPSTAPRAQTRIRYANPEKKGLKWYRPRNETYERCGRDIIRFYYVHPSGEVEWVGGVRYRALSPQVLNRLIEDHRRVEVHGVRRREALQAWSYGDMTPSGTRQANGGYEGDVYGPYACHNGDTPDDIKALFRHGVDADVLVEVGATIVPTLRSEITAVTNAAEVNRLGRYGLTSFYCSNYISAVHQDFDYGKRDIQKDNVKKTSTQMVSVAPNSEALLHLSPRNALVHLPKPRTSLIFDFNDFSSFSTASFSFRQVRGACLCLNDPVATNRYEVRARPTRCLPSSSDKWGLYTSVIRMHRPTRRARCALATRRQTRALRAPLNAKIAVGAAMSVTEPGVFFWRELESSTLSMVGFLGADLPHRSTPDTQRLTPPELPCPPLIPRTLPRLRSSPRMPPHFRFSDQPRAARARPFPRQSDVDGTPRSTPPCDSPIPPAETARPASLPRLPLFPRTATAVFMPPPSCLSLLFAQHSDISEKDVDDALPEFTLPRPGQAAFDPRAKCPPLPLIPHTPSRLRLSPPMPPQEVRRAAQAWGDTGAARDHGIVNRSSPPQESSRTRA
ncbi:hypothetical protein DFH09DRAFT_1346753 [Mycena vulgaris]|nr:hypothetical protein DFH09DRAFT_1346753 [Mycena vulgaris]